jgi:hypothetical protein
LASVSACSLLQIKNPAEWLRQITEQGKAGLLVNIEIAGCNILLRVDKIFYLRGRSFSSKSRFYQ